MSTAPPPSKKEHMHKLLERGSVFVHLDPRRPGVTVPERLANKPQLVLQIGLNFPIHDLVIDEEGVRCTLSFNRTPFYCVLPWSAVYALVAEDGQVTVWPSEIPSELVPATMPAVRRDGPKERRDVQQRGARISVVPPPPPLDGSDEKTDKAEKADKTEKSAKPEPVETRKPRPSQRPVAPRALPALALDVGTENAEEGDANGSTDGNKDDKPEPPKPSGPNRPSKRPIPPYLRLVK